MDVRYSPRPLPRAPQRYEWRDASDVRQSLEAQLREIAARLSPFLTGTATWNPGSTADNAVATTTVSVRGARVGQPVSVGFDSITNQNVVLAGQVQADDTVRVVLLNKTGGALDPASGTVTVVVWQV